MLFLDLGEVGRGLEFVTGNQSLAGPPPAGKDREWGHLGLCRSLPPVLAWPVFQVSGPTSFTCFLYIHAATSFWGLPVPPGGQRLPLQEFVFFRPLTLALAPLVLQGLLPRHNQNPHMKGTALGRDPEPGMVQSWGQYGPGPSRPKP
jgi:hypothetical protein